MKPVPAKDLRAMTPADLRTEAAALRTELAKQRMGIALRSEKDTARFRRLKRHLARILTVLGEKEAAPALKKKASSARLPAPVSA